MLLSAPDSTMALVTNGMPLKPIPIWAGILGAPVVLAPVVAIAWLIDRFGVNVPYSDQWELVLLLQKSQGAGVALGDLWAQHGEQRMVFPRLVMLALAPLTNWNIRAEMYLSLALAVAMAVILMFLLFRTLRGLGGWSLVPLASASVLVFSPVQWENWLWGWSISWYLPLLCYLVAAGVLAVWPDQYKIWPALAVAMIAALVGQYSLFSGTLIWVCCLPILLTRKSVGKHTLVWGGTGLASTSFYLFGHQPSHWEEFYASWPSLVQNPEPAVHYLLFYLSRPVLDEEPGYLAGAGFLILFLGAAIFLALVRRDHFQMAVVWISIGSFSLLWAGTTMFGRLGLGLGNAGASRYTTIPILFMIATLALVSLALARPLATAPTNARIACILGVWLAATSLFLADYRSEVESAKKWHDQRLQAKKCLIRVASEQDPCLDMVYPHRAAAYERATFLKSVGWGGLTGTPGARKSRAAATGHG